MTTQWRIVCVPDDNTKKQIVLPMVFDTKTEAETWLDELGFWRGEDFTYVIEAEVVRV